MTCSVCFFRNPLSCIAVLLPFLVCAAFVRYGFSSLLPTISFLILHSLSFAFSEQKPVLEKTPMQEEVVLISDQEEEPSVQVEEKVEADQSQQENDTVAQQNGARKDEVGRAVHGYKFRSPDLFSKSESVDQSASMIDQDSEADFSYSDTVNRTPECSDVDSISDEESLIEIAVPICEVFAVVDELPSSCYINAIDGSIGVMIPSTRKNEAK